jgi:hypothetical protein
MRGLSLAAVGALVSFNQPGTFCFMSKLGGTPGSVRDPGRWQTFSLAMQELPHGLPWAQCLTKSSDFLPMQSHSGSRGLQ